MELDPDEVGYVADGATRMSLRAIDPRRALALVEGGLPTRMGTDTPASQALDRQIARVTGKVVRNEAKEY